MMASTGTGFAYGNLQRFNDSTARPWPMPAHAASRASDRATRGALSTSPSPSRHGSGARFPPTGPSSRAARERDRSGAPTETGARIRSAPVGPQEELDWMQALTDERNRVEAVERKMMTQAGHAATLEAKLNLVVTQLQSLTDDMKSSSLRRRRPRRTFLRRVRTLLTVMFLPRRTKKLSRFSNLTLMPWLWN